jgi:hypothetical protein
VLVCPSGTLSWEGGQPSRQPSWKHLLLQVLHTILLYAGTTCVGIVLATTVDLIPTYCSNVCTYFILCCTHLPPCIKVEDRVYSAVVYGISTLRMLYVSVMVPSLIQLMIASMVEGPKYVSVPHILLLQA